MVHIEDRIYWQSRVKREFCKGKKDRINLFEHLKIHNSLTLDGLEAFIDRMDVDSCKYLIETYRPPKARNSKQKKAFRNSKIRANLTRAFNVKTKSDRIGTTGRVRQVIQYLILEKENQGISKVELMEKLKWVKGKLERFESNTVKYLILKNAEEYCIALGVDPLSVARKYDNNNKRTLD